MKTRVLDSWPILEWLKGGSAATQYMEGLLADAESGRIILLMSAINVGEVYYFLHKHHIPELAEAWRETAKTLPITIKVPDIDDIWSAADLKGRNPISYADAFAAALAKKHHCPLITGDPEFRNVGDITLEWLTRH